MKLLMTRDGKSFHWKGSGEVHTQFGYIKEAELKKAKPGDILETNMGKKMTLFDATFHDLFSKIKRGPQIPPPKDVGIIIAETGLEPNWKIVDAGAGSGAISCFFAHLVPKGKVSSYDVRDDHLTIAQKNAEYLGLKNITFEKHDITTSIPQKNVDMIMLDLPSPWDVLEHAVKALKPGGFLVSYSPTIPQTSDFVEASREHKQLTYLRTVEIVEREWEFKARKVRPRSQPIGHSGFISFVRKI